HARRARQVSTSGTAGRRARKADGPIGYGARAGAVAALALALTPAAGGDAPAQLQAQYDAGRERGDAALVRAAERGDHRPRLLPLPAALPRVPALVPHLPTHEDG